MARSSRSNHPAGDAERRGGSKPERGIDIERGGETVRSDSLAVSPMQSYSVHDPNWATYEEFVVNDPAVGDVTLLPVEVAGDNATKFVIFSLSTPDGHVPGYLDAKLKVVGGASQLIPTTSHSHDQFLSADGRVAFLVNPVGTEWVAEVAHGQVPFSATGLAFHPQAVDSPSLTTAPRPRFMCRVCKATAKGLAVAIVGTLGTGAVAAAGMATIPPALLTAVATFIGPYAGPLAISAGTPHITSSIALLENQLRLSLRNSARSQALALDELRYRDFSERRLLQHDLVGIHRERCAFQACRSPTLRTAR